MASLLLKDWYWQRRLEGPSQRLKASSADIVDIGFEDFYTYAATNQAVHLTKRTDLRKVRKQLNGERRQLQQRKEEEERLAEADGGTMDVLDEDDDDSWIVESSKRRKSHRECRPRLGTHGPVNPEETAQAKAIATQIAKIMADKAE